jgi:alpha/beta superfamily hydrolase
MSNRTEFAVYFNHGSEGSPTGAKIQRLAQVAQEHSFGVESLDYRGMTDPDLRVEKLLASTARQARRLVLVGSSMGAYVATVASRQLRPAGLFLLAPAFYLEGYAHQNPVPVAEYTWVVHGWDDELIPVEHSLRFARHHRADLHLLDGDHRLEQALPTIAVLFADFLELVRGAE